MVVGIFFGVEVVFVIVLLFFVDIMVVIVLFLVIWLGNDGVGWFLYWMYCGVLFFVVWFDVDWILLIELFEY